MVELSPTIIFLAIVSSVPLQFYLSPRSTSDAQYYLHNFVDQLHEVYGRYFSGLFGWHSEDEEEGNGTSEQQTAAVNEETIDESTLKEKGSGIKDLFGGSDEPRHPRPPHIKYRVGQVVTHRLHNYRGVIIAWDEKAKAPEWWIRKVHGSETVDEPNYTILIDTRDRLIPQIAYVVERNIVLSNGAIVHPLVKHYFEHFDGTCYKSRPWHKKVYPND